MKLLEEYMNGNVNVKIYEDGTRIMESKDDEFNMEFPVNIDLKITNYCKYGCNYCHENSNPKGKHAEFKNFAFLNSWHAGCEVAIGGGMVTSYPYLTQLLDKIKDLGLIANATFHQTEFIENFKTIEIYQKLGLIKGIGVSLHTPVDELAEKINKLDNVVIYVINGVLNEEQLNWIYDNVKNAKVLVLGYKVFRRGEHYFEKFNDRVRRKQEFVKEQLPTMMKRFKVISFDNLALQQLDIKELLSDREWNAFYQGDEGTNSMFIDAVKGEFTRHSTCFTRRELTNDIVEMFRQVKEEL